MPRASPSNWRWSSSCSRPTGAAAAVTPVWAAYRAIGFGDRDALPSLRSDAADRLLGPDQPVSWPLAFLHLVAASARMGLRELDRLQAAAEPAGTSL
jgi:hypothetical protein